MGVRSRLRMNRHQVLTGAVNAGEHCFAVGSVEGIPFTAYAAGCDIVILASDFQRVQIIPGATHGNIQVQCIDCSTDTGKIAAAYDRQVFIFEPAPLLYHDSPHKLDYQWYQTGTIPTDSYINTLSWNLEGTRLLTGSDTIHMWHEETEPETDGGVSFSLGDAEEHGSDPHWRSIWHTRTANPVHYLQFSPDGLLFASAGKNDRLVKIFYETQQCSMPGSRQESIGGHHETNCSFVYIAHPRAITGLSWRKTSKYMPRGSVANMLVTSCRDSICRIWCETLLPDNGLVDLQQFDLNSTQNPKYRTHRHKNRFMQKLTHIRHAIHKRRKHKKEGNQRGRIMSSLSSTMSAHDLHKFGVHQNGITPGIHFHLAATINPTTDIPLMPAISAHDGTFSVHWLNNKELQFTLEAEKILKELNRKISSASETPNTDGSSSVSDHPDIDENEGTHENNGKDTGHGAEKKRHRSFFRRHMSHHKKHGNSHHGDQSDDSFRQTMSMVSMSNEWENEYMKIAADEALDRQIEHLLQDWHTGGDMLFSIHPKDGSLLVWLVDWLDDYIHGSFRQAQISFSSRIPNALPIGDAMTLNNNLCLYCKHSEMDIKSALKMHESRERRNGGVLSAMQMSAHATGRDSPGQNDNNVLSPCVLMLTKHQNGSLNQWQVSFSERSKFSQVLSVAHASRACGHRFRANSAACHPVLPLLLSTSHHNISSSSTVPNSPSHRHAAGLGASRRSGGGMPGPGSSADRYSYYTQKGEEGPGLCSELILWRVDAVGPLSKSGGITELARINSPVISAFSNVAWLPTLLPSSALGMVSNSPSSLFVASDGASLRVYQAVIDARALISQFDTSRKRASMSSSTSSDGDQVAPASAPKCNIVSLQSTARPGCIVELDDIAGTKQDWTHTQLLHVFQEQMITGRSSTHYDEMSPAGNLEAYVDLRNKPEFEEHFYLVVVEKVLEGGSAIHMWRIVISSEASNRDQFNTSFRYAPDSTVILEEKEDASDPSTPIIPEMPDVVLDETSLPKLTIKTNKVCTQHLDLPPGVEVIDADVASGHLSSSSIYPACFSPYLFSTACTDGQARFWRCKVLQDPGGGDDTFSWVEWDMMIHKDSSAITVSGRPITVSCAYSGRIAVAYRTGDVKACRDNPENKYVNLAVAIYECESTGGSQWTLEDRIDLRNISIPDPKDEIDMDCILHPENRQMSTNYSSENLLKHMVGSHISSPYAASPSPVSTSPTSPIVSHSPSFGNIPISESHSMLPRVTSIPSLSTIHSVRKSIADKGNKIGVLIQKHLVQLDWVSMEDGSHCLTVGVGSKINVYAPVSSEFVQAMQKEEKTTMPTASRVRPMLHKNISMAVATPQEEIRWMKMRSIDLTTADGLPPLPMHISWAREGILVVGMDNEMHVYTQWRAPVVEIPDHGYHDIPVVKINDNRSLSGDKRANSTLVSFSKRSFSTMKLSSTFSVSSMTRVSSSPLFAELKSRLPSIKKGSLRGSADHHGNQHNAPPSSLRPVAEVTGSVMGVMEGFQIMQDCGLFEAAQIANPVLPQYHPKQLLELLNFGKVRRVKAILAHLAHCITGQDASGAAGGGVTTIGEDDCDSIGASNRRTSVAASPPQDYMDGSLLGPVKSDYVEISAIPPLPLFALVAADSEANAFNADAAVTGASGTINQREQDYTGLFSSDIVDHGDEETFLNYSIDDDDHDGTSDGVDGAFTGRPRTTSLNQASGPQSLHHFGIAQAQSLMQHLTYTQLPGLSSLDQMYLLALADTVARTKTDFAERFSPDVSLNKNTNTKSPLDAGTAEAMDDCGLRYLLAMRHHIYLSKSLGIRARSQLQGLSSADIAWAFHSEAQEELMNMIPSMQKAEPKWTELRQFGFGWIVMNTNLLRKCMEKVAKASFQEKKDPLDAALYYLAMKKKNVLWGLFRSVNNKKMSDFFKNNFSEDRWRKAALKNAYALLGKQRFTHAAAFFLLAGNLKDSVEIILNKLDDLQLALVVARLYESELDETLPAMLRSLLYTNVLGCNEAGREYNSACVHPDPFYRSMAFWVLKDYRRSLRTLLDTELGYQHDAYATARKSSRTDDDDTYSTTPSVFNFYNYLRTHPLLMRQKLATQAQSKGKTVLLSGFSHASESSTDSQTVTVVDKITPLERRLYFTTAHAHFKAGCPALALEVLAKLPSVIEPEEEDMAIMDPDGGHLVVSDTRASLIETGGLENKPVENGLGNKAEAFDWSNPVTTTTNTADSFDWSTPLASKTDTADSLDWSKPSFGLGQSAGAIDWSQPMSSGLGQKSSEIDWSQPTAGLNGIDSSDDEEPIMMKISCASSDDEEPEETGSVTADDDVGSVAKNNNNNNNNGYTFDIMAQQLKFIACLKIVMEELSTLGTGFEVDGGHLRYQLYIWLEREVEMLRTLCNYGQCLDELGDQVLSRSDPQSTEVSDGSGSCTPHRRHSSGDKFLSSGRFEKGTLHEVILAEKMDFEAKMERVKKRRRWLRLNQQLLRTLISYCSLHGTTGGGLASIRMELMLLLQELQQERPRQQLLSPLPLPTTLPLLSASVASSKTVLSDPIRHLQSITGDLMHSVVDFSLPPVHTHITREVLMMKNLGSALSACIYQCLCDCDNVVISKKEDTDVGLEGFTSLSTSVVYKDSFLMAGARYKRPSGDKQEIPNSAPSKWPGVTQLRAFLARERDENAPKLHIMLCEALMAVYMSMFIHAFSVYDCNMLFRLVAHPLCDKMWGIVFGGSVRRQLKLNTGLSKSGTVSDPSKLRMYQAMRIIGPPPPSSPKAHKAQAEPKTMFKESFVAPQCSIVNYFMAKPIVSPLVSGITYDSEDELSSDEEADDDDLDDLDGDGVFNTNSGGSKPLAPLEHMDPNSYSWSLMRYAIVRLITWNVKNFLPVVGIELAELPVCSPLLQEVLSTMGQWEELLREKLDLFSGPPDDYIPGCYIDNTVSGPSIMRYKSMTDPRNTPFKSDHSTAQPAKRLWQYLVQQQPLQDVFIRYIFKRKSTILDETMSHSTDSTDSGLAWEPVKLIHKDQDVINSFCIHQGNMNFLAMSTHKEVIEMDISSILNPPSWLEESDDIEYDIDSINNPPRQSESEFIVVSTPFDRQTSTQSSPGSYPPPPGFSAHQSGRGGSVMSRRALPNVRKMGSHPSLPYYLTGSQDGSVRMWEWGHGQPLSMPRQAGSFPKVTSVQFNTQGNKFGASDGEGALCLWQVGYGSSLSTPFLSLQCHNKSTSDFSFVGSSSLIATSGHSSESKNVALWDTLLPMRSACVQAFTCHEHGSQAVVFAPQHQLLISGGKKGDICIFDIRQRKQLHTFTAHESAVRCLALDPCEEYFVTGSPDGDIKIWGLGVHNLLRAFTGEHAKSTLFNKSASGVLQAGIAASNHLFSCGADGSLKVRRIPDKDIQIVHTWSQYSRMSAAQHER